MFCLFEGEKRKDSKCVLVILLENEKKMKVSKKASKSESAPLLIRVFELRERASVDR